MPILDHPIGWSGIGSMVLLINKGEYMSKQNILWCIDQVITWKDENPSISWNNIWASLAECFEVSEIAKADRIKIMQALAVMDIY